MDILKSSRHSKITGDFAEALVLYWLSKYGFECARVDHTGIDLLARNPKTNELIGVSIKSRCRIAGTEEDVVNIPADNFRKAKLACDAFGCLPYFAIVVDAGEVMRGFILPMNIFLELCPPTQKGSYWKMTKPYRTRYEADPNVKTFELRSRTPRWW